MKKEAKRITRKRKGAAQTTEASTLPRVTLPPPLSIQKLDGEISVLVTCEIKRETFSAEIIVNVIEKNGGQYAKRIISWTDAASNFYFSKWRDWPAIQKEHFFSGRNIRTGIPMDPYFLRKHPLAINELAINSNFKEILGVSSPELTSACLLPVEDAVINNLMIQSIHKRKLLKMDWADIGNDYCCVVREVIAPTDDEISKFEYRRKHDNEIPSMHWFEMDEKPFPQCFIVPIAEPIKDEPDTHESKQTATDATMSKPCKVCGWIHDDDYTKWTSPITQETYPFRPKGRRVCKSCNGVKTDAATVEPSARYMLLKNIHEAMAAGNRDVHLSVGISDDDLISGATPSSILGKYYSIFYKSIGCGRGRIKRPEEEKHLGRPKKT